MMAAVHLAAAGDAGLVSGPAPTGKAFCPEKSGAYNDILDLFVL